MLKLIALGTDGTDGITKGIHLRWAFDEKLGFPPEGIRLYRREHNDFVGYCFSTQEYPVGKKVPMQEHDGTPILYQEGETVYAPTGMSWIWALVKRKKQPYLTISALTIGKSKLNVLAIPEAAYLEFDPPANRLEIEFYITTASSFFVTVHSAEGDYDPKYFSNYPRGRKKWSIHADDISGLTFEGKGIFILQFCWNSCEDEDQGIWKELTHGFDYKLPHGLEGEALAKFYGVLNRDYAHVLFRLGAKATERPISEKEFKDIYVTIDAMLKQDGDTAPVGWGRLSETEESGGHEKGEPELDMSAIDILNLSSLQVEMARILALYWIDVFTKSGYYYDYKIACSYPEDHLARLENQVSFGEYDVDYPFPWEFAPDDNLLFHNLVAPKMVQSASKLARATHGLTQSRTTWDLYFNESVCEVQIFVKFTASYIRVYGYSNDKPSYAYYKKYTQKETILKISGKNLHRIRLYGSGITIYRVHYDTQKLSGLDLSTMICGLTVEKAYPVSRPMGLTVKQLPALARYDENDVLTAKYLTGLTWSLPEAQRRLLPDGPVAWHIRHRPPGRSYSIITKDKPIFVSMDQVESSEKDVPPGWPSQRQLYMHQLSDTGRHYYQVLAIDLFGRASRYSALRYVLLKTTAPPPPGNLRAKFLDIKTLNNDNTSSDPNLNEQDVQDMIDYGTSGIAIGWEWTEKLERRQAPDVSQWKIHSQHGWHNLVRGTITRDPRNYYLSMSAVAIPAGNRSKYPVLDGLTRAKTYYLYTTLKSGSVSYNSLAESWIKQGNNSFLVVRNTGGTSPRIWVLVPDAAVGGELENGKGFTISLPSSSSDFKDYKKATTWKDDLFSHTESANGVKSYRAFIPAPTFPDPAFTSPETEPIRYAQIGMSSLNTDAVQGSVSSPVTVVAVSREAPATVAASSLDYSASQASAPDAFGKSTFYVRWSKQGSSLKYFVYRAMDQRLFLIDRELKSNRTVTQYINTASGLGITLTNSKALVLKNLPEDAYADLDSNQLIILANMPGNDAAFTQMNATPISEGDDTYADRGTDVPAIGGAVAPGDPNKLLFEDKSLDGRGANTYFYRLRTIDTAGNLSEFSQASPPVVIPQIIPVKAPVITAILGGENEIKLSWVDPGDSKILGWKVYRGTNQLSAGDWRRMQKIVLNESDSFSVEAGEETVLTDTSPVAGIPYYYGITAISEDSDGNLLQSVMSGIRTAQAYDLKPPDPPEWDDASIERLYVDEDGNEYATEGEVPSGTAASAAIRLAWVPGATEHVFMIQRQANGDFGWQTVLQYEDAFDSSSGSASYLDTEEVYADSEYTYRIKAKSGPGLTSAGWNEVVVEAES